LPPEYTFVPWLRRGVAAEISAVDRLGARPDDGPDGRAAIPVELSLDYTPAAGGAVAALPAVRREVFILGPGDVATIKVEAMIRTQPAAGALGATPGELVYVEFYDEDFPWRYTPAAATAESRLRPWIALLVLTENEFDLRERSGALPVLTVDPTAILPPRLETWAWAHAQLSRVVAAPADVDAEIRGRPDQALSRLLSPRRLLPSTAYHAFLVPAFESGRLVGLGRDASKTLVQKPAWGAPSHEDDRDLPVYHRFSFTTGTAGDFETLARKLVPAPVGQEFGKRPLDVSELRYGMTVREGAEVQLEGALAPPDFERVAFEDAPGGTIAAELERIIDAGEQQRAVELPNGADPLVVPPIYGRWHANVPRVVDAAKKEDLAWLRELNLDLRSRAAAGLGGQVVRERQEELVQRAWEQVGRVEEANQRLREAELARSVGEAVYRKHVAPAGDDRVLVLTSTAQAGLSVPTSGDPQSIRGAVDESRVPAAAQAPAFRRITRPQRPLMRRLTGERDLTGFQGGLLEAMNGDVGEALSAAPPPPDPAAGVTLSAVTTAVGQAITNLQSEQNRPDRVFLELVQTDLSGRLAPPQPQDLDLLDEATFRNALLAKVDQRFPPATSSTALLAIAQRVKDLINAITTLASDGASAAVVTVSQAAFAEEFGNGISGKAFGGVTVMGSAPPVGTEVARATELSDVQRFGSDLGTFGSTVVNARPNPDPPDPLAPPSVLAPYVLAVLHPKLTLGERLAAAVPAIAERPASDPDRMAPVMAHPQFRDPLFEPLRQLSQEHIIANVTDLPRDSLTLMEPNPRFIESYLAGANHAFAQELLWREYPTDRRGTYFQVFWDTRDALSTADRDDIQPLPDWKGALGDQAPLPPSVLVLVVRGELLEKFPSTVVYAQKAKWPGTDTNERRVLDPAGPVKHPIFHARLQPDITIVGFDLGEEEARGHRPAGSDTRPAKPGWFFVLMERPGEPRFGLDEQTPATGLQTWNDLAWDALDFPEGTPHVEIAANETLAPTQNPPAVWGRTAADMAAILFQSPVLMARHASEMLP
jgi:hypothetical protein